MNTQDFRELLKPPVSRQVLIAIISRGLESQPIAKAVAKAMMLTLPQDAIDHFAEVAVEALDYIDKEDNNGLQEFLKRNNVPPDILEMINAFPISGDRGRE